MTEQDYINVSDNVTVAMCLKAIENIVPGNSSVIEAEEYSEVVATLTRWGKGLYKAIDIKEE